MICQIASRGGACETCDRSKPGSPSKRAEFVSGGQFCTCHPRLHQRMIERFHGTSLRFLCFWRFVALAKALTERFGRSPLERSASAPQVNDRRFGHHL